LQHFEKLFGEAAPAFLLTTAIRNGYELGTEALEKVKGVKLVARGTPTEHAVTACVFSTDANTFLHNSALREEVFGPVTLIVTCSSLDEATSVVNSLGMINNALHELTIQRDN
jgi:NADP-dependent aldehyde dehydrogenase